jgi:hypothetical protein
VGHWGLRGAPPYDHPALSAAADSGSLANKNVVRTLTLRRSRNRRPRARGCQRWKRRGPTWPFGRQLPDTMVEHRSLASSPPWAGRDGEGRTAAGAAKGQRGAAIHVRRRRILLFQLSADHRRLVCSHRRDARAARVLVQPCEIVSTPVELVFGRGIANWKLDGGPAAIDAPKLGFGSQEAQRTPTVARGTPVSIPRLVHLGSSLQ